MFQSARQECTAVRQENILTVKKLRASALAFKHATISCNLGTPDVISVPKFLKFTSESRLSMEATKKDFGFNAVTVVKTLATMVILQRIEPFSDVKSATQIYAAIVCQFAEIPKIQTVSIQRNNLPMNHLLKIQKMQALVMFLTTLSLVHSVQFAQSLMQTLILHEPLALSVESRKSDK